MADIITTLHPEGVPEDDLYPNIKKENLPTQLQPVADFALSEYEKTLNIWDEVWEYGGIDDTTGEKITVYSQIRSKNYIKVTPGETYYFRKANGYIWVYAYDENFGFIQGLGLSTNTAKVMPSTCHYILFKAMNSSSPTSYQKDILIAKGSSPVNYRPYYGEVLHTVDSRGVELWENGDPSSVFANQSITVVNINDYSYLEIEYKYNKDLRVSQVMRVSTSLTGGTDSEFIISCSNQDQASNVASRSFIIQNDTTIYVGSGGFNGNVNQAYIIPVAIYGIK